MKKFGPLWFVIFASFFCYASMLTMFVPLLQDTHSPLNIVRFTLSERNILSGVFLSLYPLGQFFGSPIIGALSDKFGRKNVMVISLSITIVCLFGIAYAIFIKSLLLLAIGCFVAGLGESNMALALSAIADLTTHETRGSAFARAFVMCSIGYITGSMFGGVASFIGYGYPFVIEGALVILTFVSIQWFFTDSVQQKIHKPLKIVLMTFVDVFRKTALRPYYLANFIAYLAAFGILRVELMYMQEYFHLTQVKIAMFYSYASILAMAANFIVTPFLLKRMSAHCIVLTIGLAAFASGIIFILPTHASYLWCTTALIGFFIPIILAMIGALISGKALPELQGAVLGNNQSLQVLAEALSATAGGLIFALNPQAPFFIFAALGFFSLAIYKRIDR